MKFRKSEPSDEKREEPAPEATEPEQPAVAEIPVSIGGAPSFAMADEDSISVDVFVRSLGSQPGVAGFFVHARNNNLGKRTSAEWRAAMAEHLCRPVR